MYAFPETPGAGSRVLFLDADAVLRRMPDGNELEGVEAFEAFLRQPGNEDVRVVPAGIWKRYISMEGIRRIFSGDIADRILGKTPDLEGADEYVAHVEIFEWLRLHPEVRDYVVLEHCNLATRSPVVECGAFFRDGEVFSDKDFDRVKRLLDGEIPPFTSAPDR